MHMKKTILSLLIIAAAAMPALASAASVSIAPSAVSVAVGQRVTVAVTVNPQDQTVYTAKVSIAYSSDVLEALSFTPASSGMALVEPGYDAMGGGSVIKT